ncbi:hypothetical protein KO02_16670 [Sphingobacterium sp. ML3W]|uniref:hypothetical protein n=1 Tax=Sphingobacterium sp. ML3W TaxID=1538644 RepID=UPI0004F8AE8D|nr:hypothetical protein [Sphingobacterium sp. ML3W]AIM38127.1 hypothetical protein KO02_16670 [Sphingobacterium sp. ML3W]
MPWYQFTPPGIHKDPTDPNQYTYYGNVPSPCAGSNLILCSIQAFDNMGKPIITVALISEIAIALENKTTTVNVFLKPS